MKALLIAAALCFSALALAGCNTKGKTTIIVPQAQAAPVSVVG